MRLKIKLYLHAVHSTIKRMVHNNIIKTIVFIDEMLHVLKKKLKYRKLFIRKMSQAEALVPLDVRVIVLVHNSYL